MVLSPRQHELLSIILLGVGTAIIFCGYDVQAFFAESIIHSVHERFPEKISQYAGYYGQAIHYFGFGFFSLFTASLDSVISSKVALVIMSLTFCSYYVGFYHINGWYYYFTQLLMGLGYALFNTAEGNYLAEHSSEKTLVSNSGIETGVGHMGVMTTGIFLFIFNHFYQENVVQESSYRNFSIEFIQIMYSALLGLTILSGIVFGLLPSKQQLDAIARKHVPESLNPNKGLTRMVKATLNGNVLLLAVTCIYQGFFNSFWMGVYPTCLSFTYSLKDDVNMVAFFSFFAGLAEISGFLFISPLMKLVPKHRLLVTISFHLVAIFSTMTVICCSIPSEATIRPTKGGDLLLPSNRWTVSLASFLLGLSDYTITLARCVICQIAVPEARAEVFSLTRVFMCISASLLLILAPHMTLQVWTLTILTGAVVGSSTFAIVARRTGRSIRPMTEEEQA